MEQTADHWRFFGPFSFDPTFSGSGQLSPNQNEYAGSLPASAFLSLHPFTSLRPIDFNFLRANLQNTVIRINNLQAENFKTRPENPLLASLFKDSNGTVIVTQDEITTRPNKDGLASKNLIPRLTEDAAFPMANTDNSETAKGHQGLTTAYWKVKKDRGQWVFVVNSIERAWITVLGWTNVDPVATSPAATLGFAMEFDDTKSIWRIFIDQAPVAFVNGNVQVSNFVNVEPGDDLSFATVKAFVDFNETDDRIEFFCQTTEDTVIKRTGFIDSTGLNDG